ncbi:MAG: hypothetical protein ACFFAE_10420 [Candidatus Hodarchaeota archaeon]
MTIKAIKAVIKIETESKDLAKIIHTAIDPDNLTKPPMTFHSSHFSNSLEYTINNVISFETLLATLIDLLSVFQATENAVNTFSSNMG